jgi:alpha-galactosidase
MKKIAIIGAGSLAFSSRMVADILTYDALRDAHFALVDTDPERLRFAERITRRIFKEGGYTKATCSATRDRRTVLEDCDYIITSILVGGYPAIEAEIDIPMKYGVSQAIGDTLTPGGIMRCLRTLPVLAGVLRDVRDLCPRAQVLNYTNPMSMLCGGLARAVPEVKLVGLCHSVQGCVHEWARRLDIPQAEINFICAGINHQAWMLRMEHNGTDLLLRIRQLALKPEIWLGDTSRMEYVKHFGYPVTESSGHNSEYSPWFRKDLKTVAQYCPGGRWNGAHGFIKELYSRKDWRQRMEHMATWKQPIKLERSVEYGSQIVNAMAGGEPCVIYGNVPNTGLIENLPPDCHVEVPCHIDKNGVQPMHIGALPTHLAAINRTQISTQQLAIEAALEADPEKVFQAMALDPLTASRCTLDQIRAMTRELLAAHRPYLPTFKGKTLAAKPVLIGCKARKAERHVDPAEQRLRRRKARKG